MTRSDITLAIMSPTGAEREDRGVGAGGGEVSFESTFEAWIRLIAMPRVRRGWGRSAGSCGDDLEARVDDQKAVGTGHEEDRGCLAILFALSV